MYTLESNKTSFFMYSMYANASNNIPSYTHVNLVRMWYEEPTPAPGLLGILMTKIWFILCGLGHLLLGILMTKIWVIFHLHMSTWKGGIQHGGYIWVVRPQFGSWLRVSMAISNKWRAIMLNHIPRACLKLPPLAWSKGSSPSTRENQSSPIALCASGLGDVLGLQFHKGAIVHHYRQRAHIR